MPDTYADPIGPTSSEFLESIVRLTRDLRNASITLGEREARFLVDAYYAMQRDRIRAAHQNRTLTDNTEPHDVLLWLQAQRDTIEKQIARALDAYSGGLAIGQWARSRSASGRSSQPVSPPTSTSASGVRCATAESRRTARRQWLILSAS